VSASDLAYTRVTSLLVLEQARCIRMRVRADTYGVHDSRRIYHGHGGILGEDVQLISLSHTFTESHIILSVVKGTRE
jgi:hypothetical protein